MIYVYVREGSDNIIYNSIQDPDSGRICCPDMLIRHDFVEMSIADHDLYILAEDAIRKYGSSRCFFLALKDSNAILPFVHGIKEVFQNELPVITDSDKAYVEDFAAKLMLSSTLSHSFSGLMTYYAETGGDIQGLIEPFIREYPLPVSSKKEGKAIYELIRNKILG
ncbi:MAG: hypothetical protein ACI4EN_00695 [Butyrivibrio sp.]